MKLDIKYIGGIEDRNKGVSLTGSSTLFEIVNENDKKLFRLLVDAGFFQGSSNESTLNKKIDIEDLENLDAIIITHAHLDHIGKLPYLVKSGFNGTIYMSQTTLDLAKLNWLDTIKIAEKKQKINEHTQKKLRKYLTALNYYKKLKNKHLKNFEKEKIRKKLERLFFNKDVISEEEIKHTLEKWGIENENDIRNINNINTLFSEEDIYKTISLTRVIGTGKISLDNLVDLQFLNAAHIEGSKMPLITFKSKEKNGRQFRCLIAQDIGRIKNNPIGENVSIPYSGVDYVQLETTYAGREHNDLEESEKKLIEEIINHNGPILIPAFSIQRTQQILKILVDNINKLSNKKIFSTSPLAKQVNDVFLSKNFKKYNFLLDKDINYLSAEENIEKQDLDNAIIIGSSGMLQGGSIEKYLKTIITRKNAKIIFVGYQGEGTRGREIMDGKEFVTIDGDAMKVNCSHTMINGFSSHPDNNDLMIFLSRIRKRNKNKIILSLTHGGDNRYILKNFIENNKKLSKNYETIIPELKEKIRINLQSGKKEE